jgi:hypothetical protein
MKKLSISVFAVVAIVFAVASAFTSPTTVGAYKWHEFKGGVSSSVQADFFQDEFDSPEAINELCVSTTDDELCAAKFRYDSENATTNSLGANLNPPPITGEVVEFRYIQED